MPTEQARPGMFARPCKGPVPAQRTDHRNASPLARARRLLTRTPPHPTETSSPQPPPANPQGSKLSSGRTFGQALALMSDEEIMKILTHTVNCLAKLQPGSPQVGCYEVSTDHLSDLDDSVAVVWRVTNPDRNSVGSECSLVLEHLPVLEHPPVPEVEAVPAFPVVFAVGESEKHCTCVGGAVPRGPTEQFTAGLEGRPQEPPRIVISSFETANAANDLQRFVSRESEGATPAPTSPPPPVYSETQPSPPAHRIAPPAPSPNKKPQPNNSARQINSPARPSTITPGTKPYLAVPPPSIHRPSSTSPRSRPLPQRPTAASQQEWQPVKTYSTPAPPPNPAAIPSTTYLALPPPTTQRPSRTNTRPVLGGQLPRSLPYPIAPHAQHAQHAPEVSRSLGAAPYPEDTTYIPRYVTDSTGNCVPS